MCPGTVDDAVVEGQGQVGLAEEVIWAVSHRVSSTSQRGNPRRRLRRNPSCGGYPVRDPVGGIGLPSC